MITLGIRPTQDDIYALLGQFMDDILPGLYFAQGQVNRVPEPRVKNFIIAWPLFFTRLATNVDTPEDNVFAGSITGDLLAVSTPPQHALQPGDQIFGVDVANNTRISVALSPTTFTVAPGGQAIGLQVLSAGHEVKQIASEFTTQLDAHGPVALDNAQTVSTMFRDAYATEFFAARDENIMPLHADDPRQMPFINGEQQYEDRFIITMKLQVNQFISISQQFADELVATIKVPEGEAS